LFYFVAAPILSVGTLHLPHESPTILVYGGHYHNYEEYRVLQASPR
jgi:hypothetical protein